MTFPLPTLGLRSPESRHQTLGLFRRSGATAAAAAVALVLALTLSGCADGTDSSDQASGDTSEVTVGEAERPVEETGATEQPAEAQTDEPALATDADSDSSAETEQEVVEEQDPDTGSESDLGQISVGKFEASHGPGSLILATEDFFFDLELLGDGWAPLLNGAVGDPQECSPRAAVARNFGSTQNYGSIETTQNIPPTLNVTVEVHESAAQAQQRIDDLLGDDRSRCMAAILDARNEELLTAAPGTQIESETPGGTEIATLIPVDGARTVTFDWAVAGFGPDVPTNRIVSGWADAELAFFIEVTPFGDFGPDLTRTAFDLIQAEDIGPITRNANQDAAFDAIRSTVLQQDSPAEFFDSVGFGLNIAEADLDAVEPPCVPVEGAPAHITGVGPVWITRTRGSQIGQYVDVYNTVDEAADLYAYFSDATMTDCMAAQGKALLPGEITITGSDVTTVDVDGHEVVVGTVTGNQTVNTGFAGDIRIMQTLSIVDNVLVGWQFVGLDGDEPDLVGLHGTALAQLKAGQVEGGS